MSAATRIVATDVRVAMRDGIALATDVFLADDGRPHPVMLVRTPYSRGAARSGLDPIALVRDGWAVVVQDVRGRWESAGSFDPFRQELADGAATVAWCAAQPWSTGAVVMTGASYDGITQWMAALAQAPALRAISPTVSAPQVRDVWIRDGGALNLGFLANWGIGLGMLGTGSAGTVDGAAMQRLDQWSATVAADEATELIAEAFPQFTRWLERPDSPYWTAIEPHTLLPLATVPAYHLTGWFDIFCEGSLDAYRALAHDAPDERTRRSQRLVVGPWTHGQVFGTTAGELDFGMTASGFQRFPAEQRTFLRDAATDAEVAGGASVFLMGRNQWIDLPSWPPPATDTTFYLDRVNDAGLLRREPATHAGADRWRHDPAEPVPTRGGRTLHPGLRVAGPVSQATPSRPDVVSYTSEALPVDLTIMGAVRAVVLFETSADITDLTAKLIDVHPDGAAYNVVDSVTRIEAGGSGPTWVTVQLGSTAQTLRAGHHLRLDLASSNFPRYDRTRAAAQAVWHGPRAQSRLVLPIVNH